jgi:hypothetical protein
MPRDLIALGLAGFQALRVIGFAGALNVLFQALIPATKQLMRQLAPQPPESQRAALLCEGIQPPSQPKGKNAQSS